MYSFIIENGLLYPNQSGFKQRDSCINQFLTITHALYQSLNQGFEVSGVYFRYFKGICQGLA